MVIRNVTFVVSLCLFLPLIRNRLIGRWFEFVVLIFLKLIRFNLVCNWVLDKMVFTISINHTHKHFQNISRSLCGLVLCKEYTKSYIARNSCNKLWVTNKNSTPLWFKHSIWPNTLAYIKIKVIDTMAWNCVSLSDSPKHITSNIYIEWNSIPVGNNTSAKRFSSVAWWNLKWLSCKRLMRMWRIMFFCGNVKLNTEFTNQINIYRECSHYACKCAYVCICLDVGCMTNGLGHY